jgi:hypothetical protein
MPTAGVHSVGAVQLAVGVHDPLVGEEAAHRHRDVHADGGVALAQHKPVPLGVGDIGRIDVQSVVVEHRQDVRDREIASDVHGSLVSATQMQQLRSKFKCEVFQLLDRVRLLAHLKRRLAHHMPPH